MQVDGPALGFVDQGGDTAFDARYAVWPHGPFQAAASMRVALEDQDPLVAFRAIGPADAPLPTDVFGLVTSSDPDVIGWAVKPHEDGIENGVVTRWWNLSEGAAAPSITVPWGTIVSAVETTHVETDLGPAPVDDAGALVPTLAAEGLATFRFVPRFDQLSPTAPTDPTTPDPSPGGDDDGPDFPIDEGGGGGGGCGCGGGSGAGWLGVALVAVLGRQRSRCTNP